jgi:PTH1 family peptidyl-tRNA hydrolase
MRLPFQRRQPDEPPRILVVGLGNPGAEYHHTRHNVGFETLDLLARAHNIPFKATEKRAWVGFGSIEGVPVLLAKPLTYMNNSGESVGPLMRLLELKPEEVIVVSDEMNLPVGRIRVRRGGSAGGHNGLKSLIQHLRSEEFPRVRIGVGRPPEGAAIGHVLGKFERGELEAIRAGIEVAAEAVEVIVSAGVESAMNRFNPPPTPPAPKPRPSTGNPSSGDGSEPV